MRYGKPPTMDYWDTVSPPLDHPQAWSFEPIRTHLLWPDGTEIYKYHDPIGFVTEFKPRVRVKAKSAP